MKGFKHVVVLQLIEHKISSPRVLWLRSGRKRRGKRGRETHVNGRRHVDVEKRANAYFAGSPNGCFARRSHSYRWYANCGGWPSHYDGWHLPELGRRASHPGRGPDLDLDLDRRKKRDKARSIRGTELSFDSVR